jgi:hypothetical protein
MDEKVHHIAKNSFMHQITLWHSLHQISQNQQESTIKLNIIFVGISYTLCCPNIQKAYTILAKFQCCPQLQYGSHRIHYSVELSGGDLLHQISPKWVTKYGKYINIIIYVLKYSKTANKLIFTHPMPARQLAVKNTSMEFHKNMTNGLVTHTGSQTDGQMSFPHKKC